MSQLDILLWLQSFRSPFLDAFFTAVNATAEDAFITVLAILLLWCVDPVVGLRFLLPLLFSGYLNSALKLCFHTSRPALDEVQFLLYPADETYAFPSGHTQNAAVLWAYLVGHYREKVLLVAALLMIPLVGLGRIYSGAHWPVDVLGGMAIGVALVGLAFSLYRFLDRRKILLMLWGQLAMGVIIPFTLFVVYPESSLLTGSAMGMAIGFTLERRYVNFPVHLALRKQALKVILGLAVLIALQMLLPWLFPAGPTFRFTRYALIGLWGTLGAPYLFRLIFGPAVAKK